VFRWHATYSWKDLDENYNFASNLILIKGLHTKLWAPKVEGDLIVGILGLPLGSLRTKWHLGAKPVARHIVYYKGKVMASPKSGLWWALWVCVCPWFICAPKRSNYAVINLLFGLCNLCEWSKCLSIFLIPSRSSNTPLYTRNVVRQKVRPNSFSFRSLLGS